jgi:predicted HTH domain antitoxin
MTTVTIELPETVFSALHVDPQGFAREMRIAAAIKWYELGRVSQAKGAEIAGVSRSAFITALSDARVSPFQYTVGELKEELSDDD